MATPHPAVAPDVIARLRSTCLALPAAYEEAAWIGTRWRIGKLTFAHVLMVSAGWPPAYAKAAAEDGPICVLSFRSALPALDEFAFTCAPFFRPGWWPDIVGAVLDANTDWDQIAGLLSASYCKLAPKKFQALVAAALLPR